MAWQLQEAKNRLSQVVADARSEGPQIITVRGRETAVVLSAEDFRKLSGRSGSLVSFLRKSPLAKEQLDLSRPKDTGRPVDL